MRILVSNDDGLSGGGLIPLINILGTMGEVYAVVPDVEKSASSHSITLHKPIRLIKKEENIYTVTGTPSDCVRFGIMGIMKYKLDLVVSGINDGSNLGEDCIYSGTVAAAREGAMMGYRSMAVSLVPGNGRHFDIAAKMTLEIIKIFEKISIPQKSFLNLNIPDTTKIKGIKITRMGRRIYDEDIDERIDPRGGKYYWIGGEKLSGHQTPGTDIYAVSKRFVAVTPLKVDQTDYMFHKKIKHSVKTFKK